MNRHHLFQIYTTKDRCQSSNIWKTPNSVQQEIKSRLKSGNAYYHSVQNILSSSLLSKDVKIKIYRTIILHIFMGMKPGI